jgi:peroxiredoxin
VAVAPWSTGRRHARLPESPNPAGHFLRYPLFMGKLLSGICLLAVSAFAQEFKLGSKVADFNLTDLTGAEVSFSSLHGNTTTVVVFVATKCPISNGYNERMNALYRDYSAKGVKFVFVNSNFSEDAAEVKEHAQSHSLAFPVYKDPESKVATRFGATVTPETFVIAGDGTVKYHGYIDDALNPAKVTKQGIRPALDAVMAGQEVQTAETKAFGCTIKFRRRAS